VRVPLPEAGAAASALAGAWLESCASTTGAVWLHNNVTTKAVIDLKENRIFITI
jgi:hypothetical protein